jgi:hypothetical protein
MRVGLWAIGLRTLDKRIDEPRPKDQRCKDSCRYVVCVGTAIAGSSLVRHDVKARDLHTGALIDRHIVLPFL